MLNNLYLIFTAWLHANKVIPSVLMDEAQSVHQLVDGRPFPVAKAFIVDVQYLLSTHHTYFAGARGAWQNSD